MTTTTALTILMNSLAGVAFGQLLLAIWLIKKDERDFRFGMIFSLAGLGGLIVSLCLVS